MKLDHYNIAAPMGLLDRVRDFYVDVLGFEEGARPDLTRPGYWLYSEGKACVHLIESDRHFLHETPGYLDHIAFRASGLVETRARLDRYGVEYRSSYIGEFNMTQLFFFDPSGTKLEINFPGET